MYNALWPVLGGFLIGLAILDAVWTTLTVRGAGPLSSLVSHAAGRAAMKGPSWAAENASLFALAVSFCVWGLLHWIGWTGVFSGSPSAVVQATGSTPGDVSDRFYFAGFTLTTLGNGDLVPGGAGWQIATVVAAVNGFALLTLFVTYTFSFINALNSRRALGLAVRNMGDSPEAIAALVKDQGSQALASRLINLTQELEVCSVQADAYPVLRHSHASGQKNSLAAGAVLLGELTLILELALQAENNVPPAASRPLRNAVNLLARESPHKPDAEAPGSEPAPAMPDFRWLEQAGLRLVADPYAAFQEPGIRQQRQQWSNWLRWHGRDWSDLSG